MPLHDWTERRGWEGVHLLWISELLRWIKPRLPSGYRAYIGSAPLLAVGVPSERPDVGIRSWRLEDLTAPSRVPARAEIEPDIEIAAAVLEAGERVVHRTRRPFDRRVGTDFASKQGSTGGARGLLKSLFGLSSRRGPSCLDRPSSSTARIFVCRRYRRGVASMSQTHCPRRSRTRHAWRSGRRRGTTFGDLASSPRIGSTVAESAFAVK